MSTAINNLISLVSGDIDAMEESLYSNIAANADVIDKIIIHTIDSGGKRIRPLFLALIARACGYDGDLIGDIGAIVEHIHTASLLHDDVIDGASIRRGKASANHIYGNGSVILAGDFLYTKAFYRATCLGNIKYSQIIANAVVNMSEAEVLQLSKKNDIELTKEDYMRIIYGKTAALFVATAECAAIMSNADEKLTQELIDLGTNMGYIFQLRDDLLDYFGKEDEIGKKPGTDLFEKKVTMPLMLLRDIAEDEVKRIFHLDIPHEEKFKVMLQLMYENSIDKISIDVLQKYVNRANACVKEFKSSEYKEAIIALAEEMRVREF